jgi:hypothetical protein
MNQQREMHPVLVGVLVFGGLATLVWVAGLIWGMAGIIGLI